MGLLMVILLSTKYFLFVYMHIDLLKLKAYKLYENIDAALFWLLFQRSELVQELSRFITSESISIDNLVTFHGH